MHVCEHDRVHNVLHIIMNIIICRLSVEYNEVRTEKENTNLLNARGIVDNDKPELAIKIHTTAHYSKLHALMEHVSVEDHARKSFPLISNFAAYIFVFAIFSARFLRPTEAPIAKFMLIISMSFRDVFEQARWHSRSVVHMNVN